MRFCSRHGSGESEMIMDICNLHPLMVNRFPYFLFGNHSLMYSDIRSLVGLAYTPEEPLPLDKFYTGECEATALIQPFNLTKKDWADLGSGCTSVQSQAARQEVAAAAASG